MDFEHSFIKKKKLFPKLSVIFYLFFIFLSGIYGFLFYLISLSEFIEDKWFFVILSSFQVIIIMAFTIISWEILKKIRKKSLIYLHRIIFILLSLALYYGIDIDSPFIMLLLFLSYIGISISEGMLFLKAEIENSDFVWRTFLLAIPFAASIFIFPISYIPSPLLSLILTNLIALLIYHIRINKKIGNPFENKLLYREKTKIFYHIKNFIKVLSLGYIIILSFLIISIYHKPNYILLEIFIVGFIGWLLLFGAINRIFRRVGIASAEAFLITIISICTFFFIKTQNPAFLWALIIASLWALSPELEFIWQDTHYNILYEKKEWIFFPLFSLFLLILSGSLPILITKLSLLKIFSISIFLLMIICIYRAIFTHKKLPVAIFMLLIISLSIYTYKNFKQDITFISLRNKLLKNYEKKFFFNKEELYIQPPYTTYIVYKNNNTVMKIYSDFSEIYALFDEKFYKNILANLFIISEVKTPIVYINPIYNPSKIVSKKGYVYCNHKAKFILKTIGEEGICKANRLYYRGNSIIIYIYNDENVGFALKIIRRWIKERKSIYVIGTYRIKRDNFIRLVSEMKKGGKINFLGYFGDFFYIIRNAYIYPDEEWTKRLSSINIEELDFLEAYLSEEKIKLTISREPFSAFNEALRNYRRAFLSESTYRKMLAIQRLLSFSFFSKLYQEMEKYKLLFVKKLIKEIKTYKNLREWDKVYSKYKQLLRLDRKTKYIYELLDVAITLQYVKDVEELSKILIEQEPNNKNLLLKLANFYYAIGDFEKSEKLYKKVLEIDKTNLQALQKLSNIEYVKGNLYTARDYLKEALSYSKDNKILKEQYNNIVKEIKKFEARYKFFIEKRALEAKDVFDELIPMGGDIGENKRKP
jgi:tetratricopeptide (TPR) repeat protein